MDFPADGEEAEGDDEGRGGGEGRIWMGSSTVKDRLGTMGLFGGTGGGGGWWLYARVDGVALSSTVKDRLGTTWRADGGGGGGY
jgi:hypothetical protein